MIKLQHPQVIIPFLEIFPVDEKDIRKYLGKIKLKKITIIFFGSDSFVIPILQSLEDNFEVSAVVTASNSAIANYFKGPIFTSGKLDENFKIQVSDFEPDLFVVASYGKIIPKTILNIPKYGALNVHPSLLPKYRGSSPVPATILNGDKTSGVTIIKLDTEIDHGPVVSTREISLSGQEILQELITKLFQVGAELLVQIIPDFVAGKIKLFPQNHSKATCTKILKKEDGYFEINKPPSPEILDRMIRAYYPWPGVWTIWKGERGKGKGRIVKLLPNNMMQMEGKKAMPYKDFLNGYPDFPLR